MSRTTVFRLLLALAVLGLVDSAYLTWDHGSHRADPMGFGGGLCGAEGGCQISRSSVFSELPLPGTPLDLPVSLFALAYYAVFIALTLWLMRREDEPRPGPLPRLLFGLSLLSLLYSVFLGGYSVAMQSICPFCVVLYFINLGTTWLTWKLLGEPFGSFVRAAPRAAVSKPALIAAALMLSFTAGGYLVYRSFVLTAHAEASARQQEALPKGGFATAGRPTKGPADARIRFIEFADFECPHCRIAFKTLDDLAKDRSDVAVTFLHFPLDKACNALIDRPFHQRACELATLAECAHQQGHFFEAAAVLFEGHEAPRVDLVARMVQATGGKLDGAKIEACYESGTALEAVKADVAQGLRAELRGTPAVFLNGTQIGGAVPRPELDKLITELPASGKP